MTIPNRNRERKPAELMLEYNISSKRTEELSEEDENAMLANMGSIVLKTYLTAGKTQSEDQDASYLMNGRNHRTDKAPVRSTSPYGDHRVSLKRPGWRRCEKYGNGSPPPKGRRITFHICYLHSEKYHTGMQVRIKRARERLPKFRINR